MPWGRNKNLKFLPPSKNFTKNFFPKNCAIVLRFSHMISYIILHCLQECKAFLIVFRKKNFHESLILLENFFKKLSKKMLIE